MTTLRFRYFWMPALLSCLLIQPAVSIAQNTSAGTLAEAGRLFINGDMAGSRRLLSQAIDLAVKESNRQVEADARFYFGQALSANADYKNAATELNAALRLYEALGNVSQAASINTFLGTGEWGMGNSQSAREYYMKALAAYESLGDMAAVAKIHHSLTFVTDRSEELEHIQRGLEIAEKYGFRQTQALLLHSWGDRDFAFEDYDKAFQRLEQARSILEELKDKHDLSTVYTSMGRLYRVHGHADQALIYYSQARDIQKELGDKQGVVQSLNAMGVALNVLGRTSEALRYQEEALQLARETRSPLMVKFILEAIGSSNLYLGQNQKAANVLEEARQMSPPRDSTLRLLSNARFNLGQYAAALKIADEGITIAGGGENRRAMLGSRAQALWKLGKSAEAMRDIREATASIEQARKTLIPTDFMKQGFSDTDRELTSLAVHVFWDSGEKAAALEAAEQARSRAFLDLLATKDLAGKVAVRGNDTPVSLSSLLLTRGEPAPDTPVRGRGPASLGSASAASVEQLSALAARLDSTILSYWVDQFSTTVWVITADGSIKSAQTNSGQGALNKWIDEALRTTAHVNARGPQSVALATRSGDTVLTFQGTAAAWRHLYDALIRPVQTTLSQQKTRRLTIIPSGPLFRLSFAALLNEKGRYLIEDYELHYAPAGEVLNYTAQTKTRTAKLPEHYVLIANPSAMPRTADGKALPALPGSEEEVRRIARLLPQDAVSMFRGTGASETSVRDAMSRGKVIHIATHGILSNDDPLGSFLALGRNGATEESDGRLTVAEVYNLDLNADLVVLSACRTGLGHISGDGVSGLARAFFYAGAASVVSTLWDVADEPTSELISTFYDSLLHGNDPHKSVALRGAQLRLLQSLRKGQLRVDTPFGKLPLPEDPMLWAGFVLIGEP